MKWIGISGSWRYQFPELGHDVQAIVNQVLVNGDGIVTGGALGVDYLATQAALKLDPSAKKLIVVLPTSLEQYEKHYVKRSKEGVITLNQAKSLIKQLNKVKKMNAKALIESHEHKIVDKMSYFARNLKIAQKSDELVAFQVNVSAGTQNTIDSARKLGKKVTIYRYDWPSKSQV